MGRQGWWDQLSCCLSSGLSVPQRILRGLGIPIQSRSSRLLQRIVYQGGWVGTTELIPCLLVTSKYLLYYDPGSQTHQGKTWYYVLVNAASQSSNKRLSFVLQIPIHLIFCDCPLQPFYLEQLFQMSKPFSIFIILSIELTYFFLLI